MRMRCVWRHSLLERRVANVDGVGADVSLADEDWLCDSGWISDTATWTITQRVLVGFFPSAPDLCVIKTLTRDLVSPEDTAGRAVWVDAPFKISGNAVIMHLDPTLRVFTDLALEICSIGLVTETSEHRLNIFSPTLSRYLISWFINATLKKRSTRRHKLILRHFQHQDVKREKHRRLCKACLM